MASSDAIRAVPTNFSIDVLPIEREDERILSPDMDKNSWTGGLSENRNGNLIGTREGENPTRTSARPAGKGCDKVRKHIWSAYKLRHAKAAIDMQAFAARNDDLDLPDQLVLPFIMNFLTDERLRKLSADGPSGVFQK